MVRVTLEFEKKFSNGTYVFNSLGEQLSPKSREGRVVEDILKRQTVTRQENATQKERFETITNKDVDGDGFIGKKPEKHNKYFHKKGY